MAEARLICFSYEFAQNEFVNALECVTLETLSTESGTKDFIAVGTTLNRGEDLAVKGAVCTVVFFSILIINLAIDIHLRGCGGRSRAQCQDKKMVQTTPTLSGRSQRSSHGCMRNKWLPGFVYGAEGEIPKITLSISSNKAFAQIFIRAFDQDERLVGVAFLDVGVYVISLRAVKNLLIICDVVKSAWFVAFQVRSHFKPFVSRYSAFPQEDPYKLVVLGKDPYTRSLTSADFFFADGALSIVTCDEEGIIRMFDYDPQGQYLITSILKILILFKQTLNPRMANFCFAARSFMAKWSTGHL